MRSDPETHSIRSTTDALAFFDRLAILRLEERAAYGRRPVDWFRTPRIEQRPDSGYRIEKRYSFVPVGRSRGLIFVPLLGLFGGALVFVSQSPFLIAVAGAWFLGGVGFGIWLLYQCLDSSQAARVVIEQSSNGIITIDWIDFPTPLRCQVDEKLISYMLVDTYFEKQIYLSIVGTPVCCLAHRRTRAGIRRVGETLPREPAELLRTLNAGGPK